MVDPHTAIGWAAGITRHRNPAAPLVVVSTAHPAKFPDAVEAAVGERPALPDDLADLMEREERFDRLPPSEDAVRGHLLAFD